MMLRLLFFLTLNFESERYSFPARRHAHGTGTLGPSDDDSLWNFLRLNFASMSSNAINIFPLPFFSKPRHPRFRIHELAQEWGHIVFLAVWFPPFIQPYWRFSPTNKAQTTSDHIFNRIIGYSFTKSCTNAKVVGYFSEIWKCSYFVLFDT